MIYHPSAMAVAVFAAFVLFTLGLSFHLGRRAMSAQGYFAAGGDIHWFVNGVAFAGDYLSAASFLGICGMIAFYGYDGFLYSVGYLAGWIVALFVIAEPLKRMGRYTFADALDSRFNSRGIKLAAAVSTLVVSLFYLIPQMVGAGALVQPLLGFPHWVGVVLVGAVVIAIVVSAGMVSTSWVQFLKGLLLVVFSTVLTVLILMRGFTAVPLEQRGPYGVTSDPAQWSARDFSFADATLLPEEGDWKRTSWLRVREDGSGRVTVWRVVPGEASVRLLRCQTLALRGGQRIVNGSPQSASNDFSPVGTLERLPDGRAATGALGPLSFLSTLEGSTVVLWRQEAVRDSDGATTVFYPRLTLGTEVLLPGNQPAFKGIRSQNPFDKLNFLSLMLALFCGTASLPHILIRYYTVRDQAAARKSTVVGIACIGFFYVLTLYMGLGAMTSGAIDVTDENMAAPLLARSISEPLFAIISALAFTTVLGTVAGLIVAASGAVAHDLLGMWLGIAPGDAAVVRVGKIAAVMVGVVAIVLGILFRGMNVSFLVGWAFSIAASANLPALVMVLFWKGATKRGVTASIVTGMVSSLAWILLSGDTYSKVYGWPAQDALVPFSQPGIVTIPLAFAVLVVVSLLTRAKASGG